MYVREVELREFRAIWYSKVPLLYPGAADADSLPLANMNVLIGVNGGGKSTFLRGLASAVLAPLVDLVALTEKAKLRSTPQLGSTGECSVSTVLQIETVDELQPSRSLTAKVLQSVESSNVVSHRLDIPRGDQRSVSLAVPTRLTSNHPASFFLAAYGHARRVSTENAAGFDVAGSGRFDRVGTLFSADAVLVPFESWLPSASNRRRREIVDLVNSVLPAGVTMTNTISKGEYQYVQRGIAVVRSALSDGVQGFLAWICDLIYRLSQLTRSANAITLIPGVVLVDELDQRMHPQWQRRILSQLSAAFPVLQFVCTAHSPLVAASVTHRNLILVEQDPDHAEVGATQATHLQEEIEGMSVDQVLWSSYFGMPSTRSVRLGQTHQQLVDATASTNPERSHDAAIAAMELLTEAGRPLFRPGRQ